MSSTLSFDEHEALHELKHYLPAQAPLKDFIHHNTLHAFQNLKFFDALGKASEILGYRVSISLNEFRSLYKSKRIKEQVLNQIIIKRKGKENLEVWKDRALIKKYDALPLPRIGSLRANWKRSYQIDLDSMVHPLLFRTLCSYLDQGISLWSFPVKNIGFLDSIAEMERTAFNSFFKTPRARKLIKENPTIHSLLDILVGDASLYKQYLFDQQFAHQGW